ncbi:hypothetical protein N7532_011310 [Penicillium argentinense]|uniref:NACHT domain-containing protein n=1 Tax=Penicillium argentinense TaxID=1131581 RepID=A0A9W9EIB5_9EURO|nr:uncharacterized protein N7532_011310 [Penicillium argentinense]KAJ5082267.1 hypothetical protein N7532_011310 [Penicillium argentinense]
MTSTTSISGSNSGLQVVRNYGPITAQFNPTTEQFETSANRACLRDLQTTNPLHDKCRIEADKGGLLKDAYNWILDHADFKRWRDEQQSQLLWIKGDPGKGKTMLLCGIIDELTKSAPNSTTISYFLCQATDARINHATAVLRGLILMLVDQQPSLISYVRRQYDKAGKQIFENVNAWEALSEIFTGILEDPLLQTTYLIIDALDECTADRNRLLDLVALKSSAYPHIKWIVSSRNLPAIEESLDAGTQKTNLWLELNEKSVADAVAIFINHKVQELTEKKKYNKEVRHAVSQHLLSNAHGTFLWVALVCEKLADVPKRNVRKKLEEFPSGLEKLYERMFDQISESNDAELCKSLLGIITTVYRPITLDELASCIDLPEEVVDDSDLREIIGLCGSFLTLRERTITLVHQSAKDFLLRTAVYEIFPDGEDIVHYSIFSKSLQAISRTLQRDIYNLVSPGCPIDQVSQPNPDPLTAIRYACVYWIDHLNRCSPSKTVIEDLQNGGLISIFFQNNYLHWLEALSLLRSVSEGVASMLRLQGLLKTTTENSHLINRVQDACRFILYLKIAIENHPLQVYASGLIFSPTGSITRIQFETEDPPWIIRKPRMEEGWSACLQTLEDHSDRVNSVVFSHDSKLLASASDDRTVKVWDSGSGQCLRTLKGHSDWVSSVAFSHDSKFLASASYDGTVKMWDAGSGQCLLNVQGHSGIVYSVVFSHDSKNLAFAVYDLTVHVWDVGSGQCLQTLKGHSHLVRSVSFSHDSKLLASASDDRTVNVWDASSGQFLQALESHSNLVHSVTFSYNSRLLTSASDDGAIKVWDADSGQCLLTLQGHRDSVNSVAFSCDSNLLASASYDSNVNVWDAGSGQCLLTLEGHSDRVNLVTFSHNSILLTSVSLDGAIKVWDTGSGQCLQTLEGHSHRVKSVAFSHDSKLLASASYDGTVKMWDACTGQCLLTLEGHSSMVNSVIFSYDSNLLASASYDSTIIIWDACSGQCLQILQGHSSSVNSVAFSHDSTLLASASDDCTVKVWDADSSQCLHTLIVKGVTVKSFDNTNTHLETDIGNICLSSVPTYSVPFVPKFKGYSISSDGTWITWNSENLLWLPPKYRPSTSAVSQSTICLGCSSGRVLLFTFDSSRLVGAGHYIPF